MSTPPASLVVTEGWEGACGQHGRDYDPACTVCAILLRAQRAQRAAVESSWREAHPDPPPPVSEKTSRLSRSWEIPPRWQIALVIVLVIAFFVLNR